MGVMTRIVVTLGSAAEAVNDWGSAAEAVAETSPTQPSSPPPESEPSTTLCRSRHGRVTRGGWRLG